MIPERNWLTPILIPAKLEIPVFGSGMYRAVPVIYDGVWYPSIHSAAKAHGVSRDKITGRKKNAAPVR